MSEGFGQTVTVRKGEVETIEYNRDKGIGVTVYVGQHRGHASTLRFFAEAIRATVDAALAIARFTAEDDVRRACRPRAPRARRAATSTSTIRGTCRSSAAIELAQALRKRRRSPSTRASPTPKAPTVARRSRSSSTPIRSAFSAAIRSSRHGDLVLADRRQGRRRCSATTGTRPRATRRPARRRTCRPHRRRARGQPPRRAQVATHAGAGAVRGADRVEPARRTSSHAVSGGSLYRKSSFLLDTLGKQVFAPLVQISRAAARSRRRWRAAPFDEEGVATRARDVVKDGVLQGYFLGSYSARKLGMEIDRQRRRHPQPRPARTPARISSAADASSARACSSPS